MNQGGNPMKTMAISEFKAHSLQVLGEVARTKEAIVVTKRGKPLVEVVPFRHAEAPVAGKLSHTFVFEKDIVSPLGEAMWSACK
jgi:prevent-host-death family protein